MVAPQPAVAYVQPPVTYVPSSTVYVIPDTQTQNYYAYYYRPYPGGYYPCYTAPYYYGGCRPSVSFAIGYGGGHWGGYYRAGFHGSWYH